MTHHHSTTPSTPSTPEDAADTRDAHEGRDVHDVHDVVARVLSRTGTALASTAAQHEHADGYRDGLDDGALEREARAARRAEKHAGRAPKGAKASDGKPAGENA